MSALHPIIVVTGSSGAGTTTVKTAFQHIFFRENIRAAFVEGDSFHRYNREEMREALARAQEEDRTISHFGLEANMLEPLETLFSNYGESGKGQIRHYVHDEEEAASYGRPPGTFTPWEDLDRGTDLLLYEGLHGAVAAEGIDVDQYADLRIGVVPIVNLEWIQKIHRDTQERGYDEKQVTETILRRMSDYVKYITPQFSRTDINFQRVPTVDTSNPFIARDIPTADESFVVIRFQDPAKFQIDFPYLLAILKDSFMSRRNTIVVPGGKMGLAMEIIMAPVVDRLMERRRRLLKRIAAK